MNDNEKEGLKAYEQLKLGIKSYVDKKVESLKRDTCCKAKIAQVDSNGVYCTVVIKGKKYTNIKSLTGGCKVNDIVWVFIPNGNYNEMFILKFTKSPTKLSDLESDAEHRTVTDEEKEIWDGKSTIHYVTSVPTEFKVGHYYFVKKGE